MWTISLSVLAVLVKGLLVLLPGLLFPFIYFAYRQSRGYRDNEIKWLAANVTNIRSGNDNRAVNERTEALQRQLLEELSDLYGGRNYVWPLILSVATASIASFAALSRLGLPLGITSVEAVFSRTPGIVFAGIAGAYIGNLYELTEHVRTRSLSASLFNKAWVGLIGGAMLGYVVGLLFADSLAVLVAFVVGALPLRKGLDWATAMAQEKVPQLASKQPPVEEPTLQNLQGVTEEILKTLEEQRITSTEQLAYASPAKLLARTNLEWVVILDLIDQALLFNYFGRKAPSFRELGIRGSIEMGTLYDELQSDSTYLRGEAQATLGRLVVLTSADPASLMYAIRTLNQDITVRRLAHLFGSSLGEQHAAPSRFREAAA